MTPLVFMLWAPQFHFPWSGAVSQAIDPDVTWFSQMIRPGAGNARIERRAFDVASYGKQLGLITEVLLEQVDRAGLADSPSLRKLREIHGLIEDIKAEEYGIVEETPAGREEQLEALARTLLPLLEAVPAAGRA